MPQSKSRRRTPSNAWCASGPRTRQDRGHEHWVIALGARGNRRAATLLFSRAAADGITSSKSDGAA